MIRMLPSLTVPTYEKALIERPFDNSTTSSLPDWESAAANSLTDSSPSKKIPFNTESVSGDLLSHSNNSIESSCIFVRSRLMGFVDFQHPHPDLPLVLLLLKAGLERKNLNWGQYFSMLE